MNLIKNILLFIVALLLFLIVGGVATVYTAIAWFLKGGFKGFYLYASHLFRTLALGIDHIANALWVDFWGWTMIKEDNKYPFGKIKEPISSVLGKNKKIDNLTKFGKAIDWILNVFDKNHSIKSIQELY